MKSFPAETELHWRDHIMRHWRLYVALAVAVPRLLFIAINPERSVSGNAPDMLMLARNMIAGHGFVDDNRQPDAHFSPLYVGLLAGCRLITSRTLLPLKLLHMAFDIITALVLAGIVRRYCSMGAAFLFTLAFSFHPIFLHYANNLNEESLLLMGITISFATILRAAERPSARSFAMAGLVIGVATMFKSSSILLPFLLAPVCWFLGKRTLRATGHAVIYATMFVAVLVPWCYRNHVTFGRFSINPRGFGQNLWWGSDPRIFASYGQDRKDAVRQATREMAEKGLPRPTGHALFPYEQWQMSMGVRNYRDMLHQPAYLLKVAWMKATRTLYASEDRPSGNLIMLMLQIPLLIVAALGLKHLFRQPATRLFGLFLWLYVFYFWGIVAAGMPMVRYFLPAMPLLIAAAACALLEMYRYRILSN